MSAHDVSEQCYDYGCATHNPRPPEGTPVTATDQPDTDEFPPFIPASTEYANDWPSATIDVCPTCGATRLTVVDLLTETVDALDDEQTTTLAAELYQRWFDTDPGLRNLFGDLDTHHDKIVAALVALARTFDPRNPEAMTRLDDALDTFGRSHARPELRGHITLERYTTLGDILINLLADALPQRFTAAHWHAWRYVYAYAVGRMIAAQTLAELEV